MLLEMLKKECSNNVVRTVRNNIVCRMIILWLKVNAFTLLLATIHNYVAINVQ